MRNHAWLLIIDIIARDEVARRQTPSPLYTRRLENVRGAADPNPPYASYTSALFTVKKGGISVVIVTNLLVKVTTKVVTFANNCQTLWMLSFRVY